MSDPCTGPRGEDLCHLAQGPPRVDFDKLPQKRRERVAADRKEKTKPKDPRIKKALRAVHCGENEQENDHLPHYFPHSLRMSFLETRMSFSLIFFLIVSERGFQLGRERK